MLWRGGKWPYFGVQFPSGSVNQQYPLSGTTGLAGNPMWVIALVENDTSGLHDILGAEDTSGTVSHVLGTRSGRVLAVRLQRATTSASYRTAADFLPAGPYWVAFAFDEGNNVYGHGVSAALYAARWGAGRLVRATSFTQSINGSGSVVGSSTAWHVGGRGITPTGWPGCIYFAAVGFGALPSEAELVAFPAHRRLPTGATMVYRPGRFGVLPLIDESGNGHHAATITDASGVTAVRRLAHGRAHQRWMLLGGAFVAPAQEVTPNPAVSTWAVPAATVATAITVSQASPATTAWSVPTATASWNYTATPAAATAAWVVPAASVSAAVTVTPTTATTAWAVGAATATWNYTTLPDPAIATWTALDATVTGAVTVSPDPAVASWALPAATVTTAVAVTGTTATAAWTVPAATATWDATRTGDPASSTWAANDATLTAAITVTGDPAVASWSVLTPTIDLVVPLDPCVATWAVPAVTIDLSIPLTPAVSTWVALDGSAVTEGQLVGDPAVSTWAVPSASLTLAVSVTGTTAVVSWVANNGTVLAAITVTPDPALAQWFAPGATVTVDVVVTGNAATVTWAVPAADVSTAVTIALDPAIAAWVANAASLGLVVSVAGDAAVSVWAALDAAVIGDSVIARLDALHGPRFRFTARAGATLTLAPAAGPLHTLAPDESEPVAVAVMDGPTYLATPADL